MAQGHEWILQSASLFWIFTLLLSESQSKKTQTCKYKTLFLTSVVLNMLSLSNRVCFLRIFTRLLWQTTLAVLLAPAGDTDFRLGFLSAVFKLTTCLGDLKYLACSIRPSIE